MTTTLSHLAPVLVGLVVGYVLRQLHITNHADGEFLFRLAFYTCIPALEFSALSTVSIQPQLLVFPLAALILVSVGYGTGRLVGTRAGFGQLRLPVFLNTCMIVNSAFVLPFAQALYGSNGVARVAAFDVVNSTLVYTWGYAIAAHANPAHQGQGVLVRRLLTSPPIYGVALGLLVNVLHWHVPDAIANTTNTFGSATGLVITLAVGIMFSTSNIDVRHSSIAIATRLITGIILGVAVIAFFSLHGIDADVVLFLCVAPVGFNSVTFASLEKLDVGFATSTLSISLIVSLALSITVAFLVQ